MDTVGRWGTSGNYVAQTDIELGVNPGTVGASGKHWGIWFTEAWEGFGQTYGQTNAQGPPPICTLDPGTCDGGGWVDYDECVCKYSPIVVDMQANGYALTSARDGVMFDLDADGVPERTAWTAPASDEGFLAIDRNGNGKIDNGGELFGNSSRVYQDLARPTAANGFEALNFMQTPSYGTSVSDGKIDAADAVFGQLLVWTDRNHNGVSEPDELVSAAGAGIVSVSTTYREKKRRDEFGNRFKQRGTVVLVDVDGKQKSRHVFDIWFATQ